MIGGDTLYRQALPFAHRLYLTEIDRNYAGDAFFPEVITNTWKEISRQQGGPDFAFVIYEKIG